MPAAVATVRVAEPPAVTPVGLTVALAPDGAPLTVSATGCALPEETAVVTVAVAEPPAVTVAAPGAAVSEKSFPGAVTAPGAQ